MQDKIIQEVNKVWGEELIMKKTPYTIKVMQIKPGYKCSLHLHKTKEETFVLLTGQVEVTTITKNGSAQETTLIKPGSCITINPMTPHTFRALNDKNASLLECSTIDDPLDNYRIFPSGLDNG